MRFLSAVLIFLVAGCGPASDQPPEADQARSGYELANGSWFNGSAFVPSRYFVVGTVLTSAPPAQIDSVVDLGGGFVVPPFGEAHSHRPSIPDFAQAGIDRFLAEGVFYVMNHGSLARHRAAFSRLTGHAASIDVAFSSPLPASAQSHGVKLWQDLILRSAFSDVGRDELDCDAYIIIESPENIEARWLEVEASQPDFLKVMIEYSEEFEQRNRDATYFGSSGLDPALLAVIVAKARKSGLRVAAYIETAADFAVVVEAGVDIVAHLPGYDIPIDADLDRYRIDPHAATQAARRNIAVVTTTMLSVDRAGHEPATAIVNVEVTVDPLPVTLYS